MDVVSMERPRLSVRPVSDARFESVKALLGVGGEMQQVIDAVYCRKLSTDPCIPIIYVATRFCFASSAGVEGAFLCDPGSIVYILDGNRGQSSAT